MGAAGTDLPPGRLSPAVGTGFCGAYTTFSTFELEAFRLVRDGHWPSALAYVLVSVVAGFAGLALGVGLVHWLWSNG